MKRSYFILITYQDLIVIFIIIKGGWNTNFGGNIPFFNSPDEFTVVRLTREYGLRCIGLPVNYINMSPPMPKRVTEMITSKSIRFMGSSWSINYRIMRKYEISSEKNWKYLTSISDGVLAGDILFSDPDPIIPPNGVSYLIIPVRIDGHFNLSSGLIIGPLFS
jgi:hypothetical protein